MIMSKEIGIEGIMDKMCQFIVSEGLYYIGLSDRCRLYFDIP